MPRKTTEASTKKDIGKTTLVRISDRAHRKLTMLVAFLGTRSMGHLLEQLIDDLFKRLNLPELPPENPDGPNEGYPPVTSPRVGTNLPPLDDA